MLASDFFSFWEAGVELAVHRTPAKGMSTGLILALLLCSLQMHPGLRETVLALFTSKTRSGLQVDHAVPHSTATRLSSMMCGLQQTE
jgi:hypothetical protein